LLGEDVLDVNDVQFWSKLFKKSDERDASSRQLFANLHLAKETFFNGQKVVKESGDDVDDSDNDGSEANDKGTLLQSKRTRLTDAVDLDGNLVDVVEQNGQVFYELAPQPPVSSEFLWTKVEL
jgi:hypothetical protein